MVWSHGCAQSVRTRAARLQPWWSWPLQAPRGGRPAARRAARTTTLPPSRSPGGEASEESAQLRIAPAEVDRFFERIEHVSMACHELLRQQCACHRAHRGRNCDAACERDQRRAWRRGLPS
jgi:hypothetical protein